MTEREQKTITAWLNTQSGMFVRLLANSLLRDEADQTQGRESRQQIILAHAAADPQFARELRCEVETELASLNQEVRKAHGIIERAERQRRIAMMALIALKGKTDESENGS